MNEDKMQKYMNRNIRLHPLLNALTWDVIFVWTISTMFFTMQKGLSYSQTIALDSILMFCGCIFCVPVQKLFQNIKSTNAVRYGLVGYGVYLLLCIFGTNYLTFILAQPFLAFGYAVNAVKINGVLTNSLHLVKRDKEYEKVTGKGFSIFNIIECVGAIVITYIYNWNAYAAYWVSFGVVVLVFTYTFLFKEPSKFQNANISINAKEPTKQTIKKPDSYFKILASGFFVCLLLYAAFFRGVHSISSSSYKIYLNQMVDAKAIPVWLFGYLFALAKLSTAILSKYQFKFNLKFGVKSLIILNALMILSFFASGLIYLYNPTAVVNIVMICILCCLNCCTRMPNQIFINNYMQVCMPKRNMERAYALKTMCEYLGYSSISAIYAGLLSVFNNNWGVTNLVYTGICMVPLVVSLVLFLRVLIKKHAEKFTVIKDEYTKD